MTLKSFVNNLLTTLFSVKLVRVQRQAAKPYLINTFTTQKLIYLSDLLRQTDKVQGDVVECGVGWGYSLYAICNTLQMLDSGKTIWGFDSFEGLPAPAQQDEAGRPDVEIVKGDLFFPQDYVKGRMLISGLTESYINTRIRFVKGYFEDSFRQPTPEKVSFLHIDVDLYESYLTVLNHFYHRVSPGGIIAFDEYSDAKWVGARKAVDEFFHDKPEKPIKGRGIDRYYVVKQ